MFYDILIHLDTVYKGNKQTDKRINSSLSREAVRRSILPSHNAQYRSKAFKVKTVTCMRNHAIFYVLCSTCFDAVCHHFIKQYMYVCILGVVGLKRLHFKKMWPTPPKNFV